MIRRLVGGGIIIGTGSPNELNLEGLRAVRSTGKFLSVVDASEVDEIVVDVVGADSAKGGGG